MGQPRKNTYQLAIQPHHDGLIVPEIAKLTGYRAGSIRDLLLREGLVPNKVIIDGHVRCRICGVTKPVDGNFLVSRGIPTKSVSRTCLSCRKLARSSYIADNYFKVRVDGLRATAKKANLPCSITADDLQHLFDAACGKCFYTDTVMDTAKSGKGKNRWNVLSVDKIYPHLGYVRGNVVLCTVKANLIKNNCTLEEMSEWMPGWYQRIMNFISENESN